MSDGARCHYCRKNPCICEEVEQMRALEEYAVIGPGMSGTTDRIDEAEVWLQNNPRAALYRRVTKCCENGFFGDGHECRKQPA
jgi:hypothetical protein